MQRTVVARKGTPEPRVDSLPTLVQRYLRDIAQQGKSRTTVRTYSDVLARYTEHFTDRNIATITLDEVEAWVLRPRTRAVSPTTLRKDAVVVRCFHEWLTERGVPARPLRTLRFGKLNKSLPRPVDDDVWRSLWLAPLDPLDRLWLGLGYFAGLRRLEIVSAAPGDLDPSRREFTILRKGGFYAAVEWGAMFDIVNERMPHLTGGIDWPAIVLGHTARRVEVGANYIWPDSTAGDEADCNRLNKRSEKLRKAHGLPTGSITPHRLRHSAATNLVRCGIPLPVVQRQLAHSSIDITQRYVQMSGELARSLHAGGGR